MRRFLIFLMSLAALAVPTASWEASTSANLGVAVSSSQAITAVSISNNTFGGGAAAGTVVGNIGVTMSPASPAFSGTLSLSGANASRFQIAGANLETSGVVPAGTYQINIVATQAGATGSPFTQPETITGTSPLPPSASCPQGSAHPDGCSGAPVCTPGSSTCYQQTNFFTSYTPAGNISAHRPPWNVAGVDYPVGINDSCVTSGLKNPATNPPSGTSYSGGTLTVTGSNVTINCYDMTNTYIYASGGSGTLTVTNNKFDNENGVSCPYNTSHSLNMVVKYNVFHGATGDTNFDAFIHFACVGNLTAQYNRFNISSKDWIQYANTNASQPNNAYTIQYNFGQCLAASNGAHGQPHLDYGTNSTGSIATFNTWYNDSCHSGFTANGTTALCEYDPESPDANPTCSNNVLADTYGDADVIEICAGGPGGGNCHSTDTSTSTGVTGTVAINSNYILYGKAPYYPAPKSGSGVTSTVSSGNVNMRNGNACNAYVGSC